MSFPYRRLRTRAGLLLLAGVLSGCGSDLEAGERKFAGAARRYVEAWCRGDGSVEREQFPPEVLPEIFGPSSQTIHDLPTGLAVEHFEVEDTAVSGPGGNEELSEYGFDVTAASGLGFTSEGVHCISVVFRVRLTDAGEHRGQVALRPDATILRGVRYQVTRGDDWLALPKRP
ncbi:MAG: hypothetical protein QF903_01720 [Planctomycetota bacterium]|nr:hypothetical protein [Planctomycetota bacterium]MDP6764306.1 hypothetical protein [Planctomycetota bacterium]MDP6988182.1 hypothetical protein [Planctomycetota bacterium]